MAFFVPLFVFFVFFFNPLFGGDFLSTEVPFCLGSFTKSFSLFRCCCCFFFFVFVFSQPFSGIDLKGLKAGEVSISAVLSIANNFGKEWVWVGRLLGLEDSLLDSIREDHSQAYECTYKMLELWCKKKSGNATYECLARALLHRTVGMREVAEKFCVERREKLIASAVPSGEGIKSLDEKMKNLALGSSTVSASRAAGSWSEAPSATGNKSPLAAGSASPRVPESTDDCITKNFITILSFQVWRELAIKLDPTRPLGGDYRHLAEEMGYNVDKILYFQSRKDPTEALLMDCANLVSIDELCNKLETIGRSDARKVVDEWIKSQDCKCAACNI